MDDKYEVIFRRAARAECMRKAEQIVDHIKHDGLTPVYSGRLINSYEARETERGAIVTSTTDYWIYVEYGTRNQFPQSHVRPAFEAVRLERR